MDALLSQVVTIGGSLVVGYLSQFLVPRVKIRYWISNKFLYTIPTNNATTPAPNQLALPQIPPPTFNVLVQSINVQNFGRKTAGWVEIVHANKPNYFQFSPPQNYTESLTPAGQHVIRINSLAPKQWFTLQFLCMVSQPVLLYINSEAGHAQEMKWMPVRRFPMWVYRLWAILILIGTGAVVYWFIRFVEFLLRVSRTVP